MTEWLTVRSLEESARCRRFDDIVYLPRPLIDAALMEDQDQHFAVVPSFPYTGAPYIVMEGGLVEDTVRTFGLCRLMGIRQLSYMHDPLIVGDGGQSLLGTVFTHKRYNHVLDVMALATLMAENNGLSPTHKNTLRVAALAHDALTPAGGDTTKLVDPAGFDEDRCFPELLARVDWSGLQNMYGIDERLLVDTIQGRGVLGKLLDLADKMAYVSRDAWHYVHRYGEHGPFGALQDHVSLKPYVEKRQYICGLWDAVRVDHEGQHVVITDPDRLADFLRLRLLLFKQLYYHPGSRFLEFVLVSVMLRFLYQTGKLTRDDLLRMDDNELDRMVGEAIGVPTVSWTPNVVGETRTEMFRTLAEAKQREAELFARGMTFCTIEDVSNKLKPSMNFLVQTVGGVMPFPHARPEVALELEGIARLEHPYRLYCLVNPNVSPLCLEALALHRRQNADKLVFTAAE